MRIELKSKIQVDCMEEYELISWESATRYQKSSNCLGIRGDENYRKSIFWNSNNSQNDAGVQFTTT